MVVGAVGNVGRSAVYRLKEHSATVIGGVLRKQAAEAKRTGPDSVVSLDDDEDVESLPTLDAVADTINGATAAKVVRKLKPGGVFASVLAPPSNAAERPDMFVKTMQVKPDPKMLLEMARAVQSGKLSIPIGRSFPFERRKYRPRGGGKRACGNDKFLSFLFCRLRAPRQPIHAGLYGPDRPVPQAGRLSVALAHRLLELEPNLRHSVRVEQPGLRSRQVGDTVLPSL